MVHTIGWLVALLYALSVGALLAAGAAARWTRGGRRWLMGDEEAAQPAAKRVSRV